MTSINVHICTNYVLLHTRAHLQEHLQELLFHQVQAFVQIVLTAAVIFPVKNNNKFSVSTQVIITSY